jgi:hypothetical protein
MYPAVNGNAEASPKEGVTMKSLTMKSLTTKVMLAAAALALATGIASAQSMKADIPFTFRVSGMVMTAGTYEVSLVSHSGGAPTLRIWNADRHESVLAIPAARMEAMTEGNAKLVFQCGASRCSLIQVWNGTPSGYMFNAPKMGKDEERFLAVIPLRQDKGE